MARMNPAAALTMAGPMDVMIRNETLGFTGLRLKTEMLMENRFSL